METVYSRRASAHVRGRLREAHEELERHLAGHRLLAETLRRLDAERSSHLGRALAKPVTERFLSLVEAPILVCASAPPYRRRGLRVPVS